MTSVTSSSTTAERDDPQNGAHKTQTPEEGKGHAEGKCHQSSIRGSKPPKENKAISMNLHAPKLWKKLDLDLPTVLMMMKGALPPTIALAMYQADSVAQTYSTLGYLIAIVSILGFCIMPRAKFIQNMVMNLLATCISSALCMLMVWSGVQARINTSSPASTEAYNSSQSAVCGVWLFFLIWLINTIKSKFPQLTVPSIVCSIFVIVSATFGTRFRSSAEARGFIRLLLIIFLTGSAIATVVSLLILPTTSRKLVVKQMAAYIAALKDTLQSHQKYLHSLHGADAHCDWTIPEERSDDECSQNATRPELERVKRLDATLDRIHGKLHGDLAFSKREIAYGKLTPDDFEIIFKHLREIMLPLKGLSSVADLFERLAEKSRIGSDSNEVDASNQEAAQDWHNIMESIHDPISAMTDGMVGGLEHAMIRLQLNGPKKSTDRRRTPDEEAKGDMAPPGDSGFADYLEAQTDELNRAKEALLMGWMESKGVKVKEGFFQGEDTAPLPELELLKRETTFVHQRDQRQLYRLLYVWFLLSSISRAILRLVRFADEKDMAKRKKRLMYPGRRRFKKWVHSVFEDQDGNNDDEAAMRGPENDETVVFLGEAHKKKKDPEHLPPENAWERFGDFIRGIAAFFRSSHASFGFRVACATMSIAIVGFLHDSQKFFVDQRLVWSLIMVSISMSPTAGQSVWAFFLRALGTVLAMIVSWLTWYIPGQHTAGIIVFLWLFLSMVFYIPLKRPDYMVIGMISTITITLITGYELQVRKLGVAAAESTGQPAYPVYLLGPYRLATVVGGLTVAFIWTFFPYPISEHSALRQKLGASLYLSANYCSVMHETVMSRIRGDEGDPTDKTSPGYRLAKARNKVFAKQMLLLQGLKMHSSFVRWQPHIGGKFPRKQYDIIIDLISNITNYSALIAYSSQAFSYSGSNNVYYAGDPSQDQWFEDFRRIVAEARTTSHEISSLLSLLSSSITNGQPLPPYLVAPQGYQLSKRMEAIDRDILSLRHIAEPRYAAFAVLQISTSCITMDLEKLLRAVKKLVGELDFSFHIVSTRSVSEGGFRLGSTSS